jgi:hypothetical protein
LRRDRAAILRQLRGNYAAIERRLRGDSAVIAAAIMLQFRSDLRSGGSAAITQRSRSGSKVFPQLF